MNSRALAKITIVFFVYVNTKQYWISVTEPFALPIILIGGITLLGLLIAFVSQIYFTTKENFSNRQRVLTLGLLTIVLALTFYKPSGLIDFGM